MSNRDAYAPGVPSWVTVLQPDPEAGARFYAGVFGWELAPQDGGFVIGRVRGRDAAAVAPAPAGVSPAWITQIEVESADETAERARAAGGAVLQEPVDLGGRFAVLADPTGGTFAIKEPTEHIGAGVVNEFGAWSMSRLDSPDPERAAAFYGELFGWTTEEFDMGGGPLWMFLLPGYVGGEPEQPVSRETVAVLAPTEGEAGWEAGFWVADVDAAAAAATEGGGAVVGGPFDLPIGRQAVLADPAGAVFSVTRVSQAG